MSTENTVTITPKENGPYVVKGLKKCTNKNGQIETKEIMALCRCGASENKPFCDGAHAKIGFSSAKLDSATENKKQSYQGKSITIHDNRSVCAHAGYCTDNLASVFRMKQEPWIDADAATVEEIVATIEKCPSGALSYTLDGVDSIEPTVESTIMIAPNGPYVVFSAELTDSDWAEGASKQKFTLCRCGASKNKPFCDGNHWNIKFSDDKN